jgi:uncharacterized protein (TIGR00255 family)
MTGFGRAEARAGAWWLGCEARSVNHRFLDLRVFLPEGLGDLEETVRRGVQASAARGRLEVRVSAERRDGVVPVRVDRALARSLAAAARTLAALPGVRDGIEVGRLLEFPGLVHVDTSARAAGAGVRRQVVRCVRQALARLEAARRAEGRHLARDLVRRLDLLERARRKTETLAARQPQETVRRLRQRLAELAAGVGVDAGRLEQEAAMLASRADISEELVKLRGHLEQARALLTGGRGPLGKRLDFLVQEMNREANTIGSKAAALEVSRLAVDMKTEIEKVREQVQNLE